MLCSLLTFLHSKILNTIARWRNVRFNFNSNKTNWICLLTWIYEWSESAKVKGKCSSLGQIFSWLACVGGGNKEEGFDYQRRKDILTLLPKALSPCFFLVNWLVSQAHQCCGRIPVVKILMPFLWCTADNRGDGKILFKITTTHGSVYSSYCSTYVCPAQTLKILWAKPCRNWNKIHH